MPFNFSKLALLMKGKKTINMTNLLLKSRPCAHHELRLDYLLLFYIGLRHFAKSAGIDTLLVCSGATPIDNTGNSCLDSSSSSVDNSLQQVLFQCKEISLRKWPYELSDHNNCAPGGYQPSISMYNPASCPEVQYTAKVVVQGKMQTRQLSWGRSCIKMLYF